MEKSKRFEKLVAKIQRDLVGSGATVDVDQQIIGKLTGQSRQVDIAIRQRIGMHDILIAIECKDHKRPLTTADIGSVKQLMDDVKPNKAIIVSASGFTEIVMTLAKSYDFELLKLVDTNEHDWKATVTIPVMCKVKDIVSCRYGIQHFGAGFAIPLTPVEKTELYSESGELLGILEDLFEVWVSGLVYDDLLEGHNEMEFLQQPVFQKAREGRVEVKITAVLFIKTRFFYKELKLDEFSGFQVFEDSKSDTQTFVIGKMQGTFNVERDMTGWTAVDNEDEAPKKPICIMMLGTRGFNTRDV